MIRKSLILLLLGIGISFLISCTPTIKYQYIRPSLPELSLIERPTLNKIEVEKKDDLYCLSLSECLDIQQNEVLLENIIEKYEMQIKEYQKFKEEYNKENNK